VNFDIKDSYIYALYYFYTFFVYVWMVYKVLIKKNMTS